MEKLETTSELQSRLSSLSVSSFPGITSKNCEANPLNRLQSTDLSRTVIQPDPQTKMDDNSESAQRALNQLPTRTWEKSCLCTVRTVIRAMCFMWLKMLCAR
uniref:Transmembrane p24 trafficking protein 8 n=1 Tax=Cyprinus carpio TaxID=7962 RepID=A0A8C1NDH6_CYPCA